MTWFEEIGLGWVSMRSLEYFMWGSVGASVLAGWVAYGRYYEWKKKRKKLERIEVEKKGRRWFR